MPEVRPATVADLELLTQIASEGFEQDPVMSWLFPDDAARRAKLRVMFGGLAEDMLGDRGTVLLAGEASACFWRRPDFDHHPDPPEPTDERPPEPDRPSPFTAEELGRLALLGEAMHEAHPREPHWYLNVVATRPTHRSRGLGALVLAPVLAEADASGFPCYLESSNPRNHTLYHRHGFEDLDDVRPDGGPPLRAMWREPRDGRSSIS
jgi:GNAT superfamily N-acetyltransferase